MNLIDICKGTLSGKQTWMSSNSVSGGRRLKQASHFSPPFRSTFLPSSVLVYTASIMGPFPSARKDSSVNRVRIGERAVRWVFHPVMKILYVRDGVYDPTWF